ncbi:MAG: hypothetical protein ACPGVG_15995 [Mycobacterium sp.]
MSAEIKCDGCGTTAPMTWWPGNVSAGWQKPSNWFQRGDSSGIQDACSRECIQRIADESGKTSVVLPW